MPCFYKITLERKDKLFFNFIFQNTSFRIQVYQQHSIARQHNLTGKLNYFNFISERLLQHYTYHCDEEPPRLAASESMHSLNRNQLCIKIKVQRDNFAQLKFPLNSHIHFDNDSISTTDCKISTKECLFIIEGITETGQEVKLFWGEKHFELLKDITLCNQTVSEFQTLEQQIHTDTCVDINKLNTVFIVVCKKDAIELVDDKLKV